LKKGYFWRVSMRILAYIVTFFLLVSCSSKATTYTLETNYYFFEHDDLSITGFEEYLNYLTPDDWDFMILTPSRPIKGSNFIQVGAPSERRDLNLSIEINIANPKKIEMYRYYTKSREEVLRILADYFEKQEIPDYKNWEDVSDEMN